MYKKRKYAEASSSTRRPWPMRRWKSSRKTKYKDAGTMSLPRRFHGMGRGSPLASELPATLIYSDRIVANPGVGATDIYTFRLNSLFDPDYSYTGHQPRGFDQLALLYHRYRVNAVKVEIVPDPSTPSDSTPQMWWTFLVGDETPVLTMSNYELEEHPERVAPVYSAGSNRSKMNATTTPKFQWYCRLKDIYDVKDLKDDHDSSAAVGSNPTRNCYGSLVTAGKPAVDPATCEFQVTITYYSTFYRPRYVVSS